MNANNWSLARNIGFRLRLSIFALAVFIIHIVLIRYQQVVNFDGCWYARWFDSAAWRGAFPPMYPLLLRGVSAIVNDRVLSGQIVSSIFGSLLVFPTYLLIRKYVSEESIAWMATGFIVLNPLILKTGVLVLSDVTYLFFLISTVYFYVMRKPALTGLFAGLGYLTRPEMLAVAGLLAGMSLIRKEWRESIIMLSVLFLISLPYLVYIRETTGSWSLTLKTMDFRAWSDTDYISNETLAGKATETGELVRGTIAAYPFRFAIYAQHIAGYAGYGIVILGLWGMVRRRGVLLVGFITLLILPLFGIVASSRLIIPSIAFLTMYAFMAMDHWKNRAVLLAVCCALLLTPKLHEVIEPDEQLFQLKTAGVALAGMTLPGDRFLDRKPLTAFYAGGEYWAAPYASLDSILHYAAENQIRFIVVSEYVVNAFRHQLEPLLTVQSFYGFGVHYSLVYRDVVGGVKVFRRD